MSPTPMRNFAAVTERLSDAVTQTRPQLRAIAGLKREKSGLGMIIASSVLLALIIAAQMGLSALSSMDAYTAASLRADVQDTERASRVLAQNVEAKNSPQNLVENAQNLGMVQNAAPAYLRLSDATILGEPGVAPAKSPKNNVANATLKNITVLNADGTTSLRADQSTTTEQVDPEVLKPVTWEGELPAPNTR